MIVALVTIAGTTAPAASDAGEQDAKRPPSSAEAFPASDGIVDLMVTGQAARTLYDRLPGKDEKAEACGAAGLHKGDGRMQCTKLGNEYSCHLWLDVPKQTLTEPEIDDC